MAAQVGFLDFSPLFFFIITSSYIAKVGILCQIYCLLHGMQYFKINQNQLEIPVAMKAENTNSAYSMSFTCNEIKNVIHSVYQITNLVTNDCSKIKERKFSKSVKAVKIKKPFSSLHF